MTGESLHLLKTKLFHWINEAVQHRDSGLKPFSDVPAPLEWVRIASYKEYTEHARSMSGAYAKRNFIEQELIVHKSKFDVAGYCFVCSRPVFFRADYRHGFRDAEGRLVPNWRECLICPACRLNNRMRAAIHLFHELCRPGPDCSLYITEQTTSMYRWFNRSFPHVIGSEYWESGTFPGTKHGRNLRNEDLTCLTFGDEQFDFVLSFDVFEHIPHYRQAFHECFRVLKKGGLLVFTVPFNRHSEQNIIRAELKPDGTVNHILPAEYHGDPLQPEGCLCFRHFGWECLEDLRNEGFTDSACYIYWSRDYGYLGGEQFIFLSRA